MLGHCKSRRIDQEHRLVCRVEAHRVFFLAARFTTDGQRPLPPLPRASSQPWYTSAKPT